MATVTLYATQSVAIIRDDLTYKESTSASVTLGSSMSLNSEKMLVIKYEALNSAYNFKLIDDIVAEEYIESISGASGCVQPYTLKENIDIIASTPQEIFSAMSDYEGTRSFIPLNLPGYIPTSYGGPATGIQKIKNGSAIGIRGSSYNTLGTAVVQTSRGTNKPKLTVTVRDTDYHIIAEAITPASGYIDETKSKPFTWTYTRNGVAVGSEEFENASAFTFEWRVGSSGTTHSITGTKSGVTVPANTFPGTGEVQARLKIVDALGYTTYTAWNSYTTSDSTPAATAVSPSNSVVTDSAPVEFAWMHTISTGTEQTAAELQYSTDGTTWSSLGSVDGSAQSLSISLAGLQPGTIFWRVRTANSDNVFSEWSAPVSFVLVAAPSAPIVSVIPVPMATISWQAAVQQAYRVTVDGRLQGGVKFGDASSFRVSAPLADGEHTAAVEVQGAFGLWSAPASVTFTVANIPGDDIELRGQHGIDAELNFETEAETNDFLIMRDGEPIGRTTDLFYSDRLVAGDHEYFVLNIAQDGNYSKSNTVSVRSGSCLPVIADIDGGEWLEMAFSPNSATEQRFSWSKTSVARHFAGAKYPVIEMSAFEDKYATYTVAFKDMASAQNFEALAGKVCIIKSRSNEVMLGALTQIEKIAGDFFVTYSFTLQQVDWRDGT